jgi:hypothetical protein
VQWFGFWAHAATKVFARITPLPTGSWKDLAFEFQAYNFSQDMIAVWSPQWGLREARLLVAGGPTHILMVQDAALPGKAPGNLPRSLCKGCLRHASEGGSEGTVLSFHCIPWFTTVSGRTDNARHHCA